MWITLLDRLLKHMMRQGVLEVTYPDGITRRYGDGSDSYQAAITLHDDTLPRKIIHSPDMAVGEAYMDGRLTIEGDNLYGFLELSISNIAAHGQPWFRQPLDFGRHLLRYLQQFNPVSRARANVAHHYDLSGALYDLFLDCDRQYSCAYFRDPNMTLEAAQDAKKHHIAAKLLIKPGMRVLDIGCGPGWNLPDLAPPSAALDAAPAMLDLVGRQAPRTPRLLALAERLPVRPQSLGGAVANRVYLHIPRADVPLALADLHRSLAPGAPAFVRVLGQGRGGGHELRSGRGFPGRSLPTWASGEFERICLGAGFDIELVDRDTAPGDDPADLRLRLRRAVTLADTVGPELRLLICGLNPSPYSADIGVGFGRPGNRFWPAARAAGVVTVTTNDPVAAIAVDRIGMTDLAKRPTRRADELSAQEYRDGLERVEHLAAWLRPAAICFVGLAGWRAAIDRRATAGVQQRSIGGRPAYLMPSTSGLNAHATVDGLADHLRAAARLADTSI